MAYNRQLADRVREALIHLSKVEEKKMFQGLTFMVNEKMCVGIRNDEIMLRIDPALHDDTVVENGVREMIHGGKVKKGFVFVHSDMLKSKADLDQWIKLALDFNKNAKATKKRKK